MEIYRLANTGLWSPGLDDSVSTPTKIYMKNRIFQIFSKKIKETNSTFPSPSSSSTGNAQQESSMQQPNVININNSNTLTMRTTIDRRALKELDSHMLKILDVIQKNGETLLKQNKTKVDINTISEVLSPNIVSEKLIEKIFNVYAVLDVETSGNLENQRVELRQFFSGLSACCGGSINEKLSYCFSLYDDDSDGKLSFDQLEMMLSTLYKIADIHNRLIKSQSTLQTLSLIPQLHKPKIVHTNISTDSVATSLQVYEDINKFLKSHNTKEEDSAPCPSANLSSDSAPLSPLPLSPRQSITSAKQLAEIVYESLRLSQLQLISLDQYVRWVHKNPRAMEFLNKIKHIASTSSKTSHLADEEREIIKSLLVSWNPKVGEDCYIISAKWWKLWAEYTRYETSDSNENVDDDLEPPGIIDNLDLIQQNEVSEISSFPFLRDNLLEEIDYVLASKEMWNALFSWYGGGPIISRQIIACKEYQSRRRSSTIQSASFSFHMNPHDIQCDLYPLALKATFYKDQKTAPVNFVCSSQLHLNDLRQLVCNQLGITYSKDIKLRASYGSSDAAQLTDEQSTLYELGITSDYLIIVEAKKKERSLSINTWLTRKVSISSSPASPFSSVQSPRSASPVVKFVGHVGLSNLGNTCFLNSALQTLLHTPHLITYFQSNKYQQDLNTRESDGHLTQEFVKLIAKFWTTKSFSHISPQSLRQALIKRMPLFGGTDQHDSQEVLGLLLDYLHMDLNLNMKKITHENPDYSGQSDHELAEIYWNNHLLRDNSLIVSLFEGQFKSHSQCISCHHEIIKFHPFMFLSLPLPQKRFRNIKITFVPIEDSPKLLNVSIEASADMDMLIRKFTGVKLTERTDMFYAADVQGSYIFKFHKSKTLISTIRERDIIYIYEDPDEPITPESANDSEQWKTATDQLDPSARSKTLCMTTILNRSVKEETVAGVGKRSKAQLFGIPHILNIRYDTQQGIDGFDVYKCIVDLMCRKYSGLDNIIREYIKRLTGDGDTTEFITESPNFKSCLPSIMQLKHVNNNGTACSKCTDIRSQLFSCLGCSIKYEGVVELNENEILALEWLPMKDDSSSQCESEIEALLSSVEEISNIQDPSLSQSSPYRNIMKLEDIIAEYEKVEYIPKDDYICPKCKTNQPSIKRETIWKLPPILMIQLKRFSFTANGCLKNDFIVDMPISGLDLCPFLTANAEGDEKNLLDLLPDIKQDNSHQPPPPKPITDPNVKPILYDLYAGIIHVGTFYNGHYVAVCKDQNITEDQPQWFLYNDDECKEWADYNRQRALSENAYVLFYQQQNIENLDVILDKMKREALKLVFNGQVAKTKDL